MGGHASGTLSSNTDFFTHVHTRCRINGTRDVRSSCWFRISLPLPSRVGRPHPPAVEPQPVGEVQGGGLHPDGPHPDGHLPRPCRPGDGVCVAQRLRGVCICQHVVISTIIIIAISLPLALAPCSPCVASPCCCCRSIILLKPKMLLFLLMIFCFCQNVIVLPIRFFVQNLW